MKTYVDLSFYLLLPSKMKTDVDLSVTKIQRSKYVTLLFIHTTDFRLLKASCPVFYDRSQAASEGSVRLRGIKVV